MRGIILALALFAEIAAGPARADWAEEVRATYDRFVAAQNVARAASRRGAAKASRCPNGQKPWGSRHIPPGEQANGPMLPSTT